jgi:diguanylate cyclase (GGDEF)-like protein
VIPRVETEVLALEERNARTILDEVVALAEKSGEELYRFEYDAMRRSENELNNTLSIVHQIFKLLYRNEVLHRQKEREKIKEVLLSLLKSVRYDGQNYFFAVDYNATMLSHPFIENGTDMRLVTDINGTFIVPKLLEETRKNNVGRLRYRWVRIGRTNMPVEKLTMCRNCGALHMILCSGIYLDDIRRQVEIRKNELLDKLREIVLNTRIGKNGYLYIFDERKILIHPNRDMEGLRIVDVRKTNKKHRIFDALKEAAKSGRPYRYKWDRPDDRHRYVYDKISWVRYVPSLDMYVASSVYVDDIASISRKLCYEIYGLAGSILLLALLFGGFALGKIIHPVERLEKAAKRISEGNLDIRTNIRTSDELGKLSTAFDDMVERLQRQINELDELVEKKTEAIRRLAVTDVLSGLYNRRYFNEKASELFRDALKEGRHFSVLMIDIDDFKRINDDFGHLKGDEVIRIVGEVLRKTIRRSDKACRYGGEEFVILMPGTRSNEAFEVAERIRKNIKALVEEKLNGMKVSVSIGIAEVDFSQDVTIEDVMKRADEVLYRAKKEGKDKTVVS